MYARRGQMPLAWFLAACAFGAPVRAAGGGAAAVIQVRDAQTGRGVASAMVASPTGAVCMTDSAGCAVIDTPGGIVPVTITRTGYATRDTVLAADTTVVILMPVPIPFAPVEVEESREVPAVGEGAAVIRAVRPADATLGTTLARLPGVMVDETGGVLAVSIRGASPSGTEAWLDGMPLSQARFGGADLGGILPGVLEQVTVYQGWIPATLGAGALGGGIALETASRLPHAGVVAHAGYGTLGRREAGVGAGGSWSRGWIWADAEAVIQDNEFAYLDDNATPLTPADDSVRVRGNNRVTAFNLVLKATEQAHGGRWSATSFTSVRHEGVPGPGANPVRDARHESWAQRLVVKRAGPLAATWDLAGTGFVQWWESTVADPSAELSHLAGSTLNRGGSVGASVLAERHRGTFRPDARVEVRHEEFHGKSTADTWQHQARVTAGVGVGCGAFLPGRVRLRGEGTLTAHHDRDADDASTHRLATGRLAGEWGLADRAVLLLSLSLQGRAPSLLERFGNAGSVRGNAALDPERSRQVEAVLVVGDGRIRVAAYHRTVENLIHFWLRSPKVVIPENIGEAGLNGVELSGAIPLNDALVVRADGTWQQSEDRSSVPYYRGNTLPGSPAWSGGVAVHHILSRRVSSELEARGCSSMFVDRANRRRVDGRLRFGASTRVDLARALLLEASGENLFDQKGLDRWGYPEPGRRLRCRVTYLF